MLHRAGNVDGEGDGCGLLLDIPRKIWAEEVRAGGHDPSLATRRRLRRRPRLHRALPGRREDPARRPRAARPRAASASSPSGSASSTRPRSARPRARRSRIFWQLAGLVADAKRRDARPLRPADRAGERARRPRPLLLGDDLRLQGDGRAERARRVLPGPARPALRDDRLLRPQPLLDQHLALLQAGPAVLGARPQRRDQHDRAAAPGGEDAGGADPARLLRLAGPQPHDRHPGQPRGLQPRRGDGDGRAADRRGDPRPARGPARASTCTCTRRWARSRRARSR